MSPMAFKKQVASSALKICIIVFSGFLAVTNAFGQQHQDRLKYWIFFSDKDSFSDETGQKKDYVTTEANQRRAIRGIWTDPAEDAPLSIRYLDQLNAAGITPLVQSRWLNAVSAMLSESQVTSLLDKSYVRSIRPVGIVKPTEWPQTPAVPVPFVAPPTNPDRHSTSHSLRLDYGPSMDQLDLVNAIPLLEQGLSGKGINLGIIDTGVGTLVQNHPATSLMTEEGRFVASQDFTNQPADGSRHAVSVLSVAVGYDPGQLIGPAYNARVFHARTEYVPTETNQEEDNLVAGLEWLEAQGVDIINISLGYRTFDPGQTDYTPDDLDGNTGITTLAADMAVERGVVVVTSAGNDGCNSPSECFYYVSTPADGKHVITVGAVSSAGAPASFSSRGPTADNRIKPDIAAMGVSTYVATTGLGYANSNGTSFSAPMISGVIALMLEVNPSLTPEQIRTILRNSASQANAPDFRVGWGIIDAEAAVNAAQSVNTHVSESVFSSELTIQKPYPNPTSDHSSLVLTHENGTIPASIHVYNVLGQIIATVFEGLIHSGSHTVTIDLSEYPAGLYFYRFESEHITKTGTLIRY